MVARKRAIVVVVGAFAWLVALISICRESLPFHADKFVIGLYLLPLLWLCCAAVLVNLSKSKPRMLWFVWISAPIVFYGWLEEGREAAVFLIKLAGEIIGK